VKTESATSHHALTRDPNFEALLTPEARVLHDKRLTSTVDEYTICTTCDGQPEIWPLVTLTPIERVANLAATALASTGEWEGHPCESHNKWRSIRLVRFMGASSLVTLAAQLVNPDAIEREYKRFAESMAAAFNWLVANKMVAGGTLLPCSRLMCPVTDYNQRTLLLLYVASNYNMHQLNSALEEAKLGHWFYEEGELPKTPFVNMYTKGG